MFTKITYLGSFALIAFLAFAFTGAVETYNVDLSKSQIAWNGYKVTGKHNGTVALKSGSLNYQDGKLIGGAFEIDMNTITVLDLSGGSKDKLENHLKSDDFFGVATYPTVRFQITKVVHRGTPGDYTITGDITIKETTKQIRFIANVDESADTPVAKAKITLDRSDFNVRYGSGSFFENLGDKTIYDEFDLSVELVLNKKV
jgi:polyisoprenoid-binding protein YceI